MSSKQKVRLCPYCEGSVPLESTSCRFCGSEFIDSTERMKGAFREEMNTSQYKPLYSPAVDSSQESVFYPEKKEPIKRVYAQEETNEEEEKGHIVALTLLSCGGMLFTLALLLLLFSEHGRLVLEWRSKYWSLYMILGLPMLYYGFKKLKAL